MKYDPVSDYSVCLDVVKGVLSDVQRPVAEHTHWGRQVYAVSSGCCFACWIALQRFEMARTPTGVTARGDGAASLWTLLVLDEP